MSRTPVKLPRSGKGWYENKAYCLECFEKARRNQDGVAYNSTVCPVCEMRCCPHTWSRHVHNEMRVGL